MSKANGPAQTPGTSSPLTTLDEGFRIAISAIRANKTRAGLTILGVAIGVAVVVTMAALITGIRSSVMEAFEAVGQENFIVTGDAGLLGAYTKTFSRLWKEFGE